jgi:site-specific DNA-methyltransferase (adenine-specific)
MTDDISAWTGDVHEGDCRDVLSEMPESSVHAVVTDPPYGLAFMGRSWDDFEPKEYQEFCESWAREVKRVLKPGGHLLAFSGNRTHHRAFSGIEDAGFEIRDTITWHYGSGFPKALDVSKAIDKAADAEREVVATQEANDFRGNAKSGTGGIGTKESREAGRMEYKYTAPATDAAEKWDGFKTALKPATEYVVVARAPLSEGTVAENVMEHGTGALNIDECRIENDIEEVTYTERTSERNQTDYGEAEQSDIASASPEGRYPSNIVFDEAAARTLDEDVGELDGGSYPSSDAAKNCYGDWGGTEWKPRDFDSGGASRYFYTSKASRAERNLGLPDDEQNEHPTVKPVDLMRWLVQLVTAEGQTVLDPFAGSGTTLLAADFLGRNWIGIERDEEHAELARRRVQNYDAAELREQIDDETVTQAEQETLDDLAATNGDDTA